MKAITVYKNVNIHHVAQWWSDEHNGYYAKQLCRLGYFNLADGSVKSSDLAKRITTDFGIELLGRAHTYAWLTSGGNLTVVFQEKNHVKVLFDGRRQGLRKPFDNNKMVEWTYVSTWLPEDCPPFLDRDAYASQSLQCWEKVAHTFGKDVFNKERILVEHVGSDSELLMPLGEIIQHYLDKFKNTTSECEMEDISEDLEAHLHRRGFKDELKFIEYLKEAEGTDLVTSGILLDLVERCELENVSSVVYTSGVEVNNPFKDLNWDSDELIQDRH